MPVAKCIYQLDDLLRRILKIVIHGDNDIESCLSNARDKRVVLTEVASKPNADNPFIPFGQLINALPSSLSTTVFDEDNLEGRSIHDG